MTSKLANGHPESQRTRLRTGKPFAGTLKWKPINRASCIQTPRHQIVLAVSEALKIFL